jgi:hypothetical protein
MIDFLKRSLDAVAVSAKASALFARPSDRASDLSKSELDPPSSYSIQTSDTDERRRSVPCEEMFYWGMAGGPGY